MTDSIWAVVTSTVKTFGVSFDYALYEMSYANSVLYSASLPSYIPKEENGNAGRKGEVIDADDPANENLVNEIYENIRD